MPLGAIVCAVQNIRTADWSEEVAPFWGAVIKSAVSADGIRGLFKAGWTTIKVCCSCLLKCTDFGIPSPPGAPLPPQFCGNNMIGN